MNRAPVEETELNAYVDGELPADAAAMLAQRAAREPDLATRIARLHRLKAAVAELMPEAARPGRDYVVVARQGTLHRPWQTLLEDLRGALARVETAGRSGGGPRGRKPGRRADSGLRRGASQTKEAG